MKNPNTILSLLKKIIYKLDSIDNRLINLEKNYNLFIPDYESKPSSKGDLNYYVGDNFCSQCNLDLSKNPVCMSVNCPYAPKITC